MTVPHRPVVTSRSSLFHIQLRLLLACLVIALFIPSSICAQTDSAAANGPPPFPPDIRLSELTDRIAAMTAQESAGELDPAGIEELRLLRETQEFLTRAGQQIAQADNFINDARTVPDQLAGIDAYLTAPTAELLEKIEPGLPLDEISQRLEAAKVRLQTERELRAKVDTDEETRRNRRQEIPNERARATERIEDIEANLALGDSAGDPAEIAQAKRWSATAERYYNLTLLRALNEELRNYDTRRPVLDKRRAFRDRKISVETQNVATLTESKSQQQLAQAEADERAAARKRMDPDFAHPLVRQILDENKAITARTTDLLSKKTGDAVAKTQADNQLAQWRNAFRGSQSRVERVGLTNAIGQHLRNQRSRLPETRAIERRMDERDELIGQLVNELEDRKIELDALINELDQVVEQRLEDTDLDIPTDETELATLRQTVRDAILLQRGYLNTLVESANEYLDQILIELQSTDRATVEVVSAFRAYINERVLWIRSSEPLGWATVVASVETIGWLLDADDWIDLVNQLQADARQHLWITGFLITALIALVASGPLLRRRLEEIARRVESFSTDRLMHTGEAFLVTLGLSIVWPLIIGLIGWRLYVIGDGTDLASALAIGCFAVAQVLFATRLTIQICRPRGLGAAHFRWQDLLLRIIRRQVHWLEPILVPLAFLVGVTSTNDNRFDSLGRIAFIASTVVFAIFLIRLLRPSSGVFRLLIARSKGGWIDRLRYVWFPLVAITPLITGVLAVLGYFYSAIEIQQRVFFTIWALEFLIIARAFLLRGLFLAQRRLRIENRRRKREAAAEASGSSQTQGTSADGAAIRAAESEEVDVTTLSDQTRQLLNAATVLVVFVGLLLIWIDILPALNFLDRVTLWGENTTVREVVTDFGDAATGSADSDTTGGQADEPSEGERGSHITLADVFAAMVILLFTVLVSKNMPGLLEITILQRLPLSASARYASTALARYVLVILGLVLAFDAIGIGWSKVQWLAAAITVGLGFGLQEIFANFVSGLIILFEQPVRVGDTVTVSGVTGTVTKLRIRATTIADWDNKELIIPNKEFVTGQIINWTLSDPILRLVIPVGIAYGSDTRLAEETLLRVAKEHPLVMNDPAPVVLFAEFGDSALNFSIRVFVAKIEDRVRVLHELHRAIDDAFRQAGIVIAFPQMDVHLFREDANDDEDEDQNIARPESSPDPTPEP